MVAQVQTHPSPRSPQDACPICGQPVTHLKFNEIQARLVAQDRERDAAVKRQIASVKATLAAQADTEIAKAKAAVEAKAQIEIAQAKKSAAAKVASARTETRKEVEAALAPKLAAGEAAGKELAQLKATHAKELQDQRAALEKEHDKVIRLHKAGTFRETERLRTKVTSLQRQLEHKTADDLGEGAEVDVYETLKAAFPQDNIRRVKRGESGADIIHEVMNDGRICGSIVYDSKNRESWRNDYVTKLKADQIAAQADHAVLASGAFPKGAKQVAIQGDVVIVNPARVLAIVQLLRKQIEQVDKLRLSRKARDEKAQQLYAFVTSERCAQLFDRIERQTDAMLELDVKEKKAHDKTWGERGLLLLSTQEARTSLLFEIERIVGTAAKERSA